MGESVAVRFSGPAGTLEGILQGPSGHEPSRSAIVCHPHPLGGGTMHTKVVHRAARALMEAGHRVLRFNFRGVGGSAGAHDRGAGEVEDALAAIDYVASIDPGLPVTMAGFSFGAWVGLRAGAGSPIVDALVGIAPPANLFDFSFLRDCPKPKLFIHGTADTLAPLEALEALLPAIPEPKLLVRISGGTHLLTGHLPEVAEAMRLFARSLPAREAT